MAELINEKDSLNKGRIKLNDSIKQSERAEGKSDEALSTANTAKSTADTTRYEMQEIIREQTAGGDIVPEVVQARGTEASLGNRLNSVDSQLADNLRKLSYKYKQSELISKFYINLTKKQPLKWIAEGDSLTYGHDVTSADIRPPSTTLTDNGVAHTYTRASITYPEKLQENLREVYGVEHVVINKGYSGDYAGLSYEHWNHNENADIALLMLGTNDASDSPQVPVNTRRNIEIYVRDMRKLIERFLDWDTPVMLLTPPRRKEQEFIGMTNNYVEPFRQALHFLGEEYDCPVIDVQEMFNGSDNSFYSDSIHFNGKGYTNLANRLTSMFVGNFKKPRLFPSAVISNRPTRDNMVVNGATFSSSTASAASEESSDKGSGVVSNLSGDSSIYLSYYAETDNLVLIPIHGFSSGASAKYTLDFAGEQGSVPLLPAINRTYSERVYPPSVIESTTATNQFRGYNGEVNIETVNDYIHITNKGLHSIKIENGTKLGNLFFHGFIVLAYNNFANKALPTSNFVPVVAPEVSGTVYNSRVCRIKKKDGLVYAFVTMNITFGTITGSLNIRLKDSLENATGFKVNFPIHVTGAFTDGTTLSGVIQSNSPTVYLLKTINGETTNLRGEDVSGKTVELTFTAIYPTV